jgi:hypothetical protein
LFDSYVAAGSGAGVAGVTGTGASDVNVAFSNGLQGKIARWDGSVWTTETLPEDPFSVAAITTDASGDPWAVITERGVSRSGVGGASAIIHRRNGVWIPEPKPHSRELGTIGGTSSGLFLNVPFPATAADSLWAWQNSSWQKSPVLSAPADGAKPPFLGAYGFWGAGCGEALAFGGGATTDTIFASLFRLHGGKWVSVPLPALTEIVAVTGPSLDDLYVLAWNRNQDGTSRLFHVTNDLQTWTPLPTPATVDYAAIWSSGPSIAVAFGCEWPDKTVARSADCLRLTVFSGDTVATAPLPSVEGAPLALWREPQAGSLHLFTYLADANGGFRAQHYLAPPECPSK